MGYLGRTKGLMLRARTADAGNNCRPLQYPERVICRNDTNSNEIVPEDVGSRPRSLQNFRCQHSLECLRGHVSPIVKNLSCFALCLPAEAIFSMKRGAF